MTVYTLLTFLMIDRFRLFVKDLKCNGDEGIKLIGIIILHLQFLLFSRLLGLLVASQLVVEVQVAPEPAFHQHNIVFV